MGEQAQEMYCVETGANGDTVYVSEDLCERYSEKHPVYKRACEGDGDDCPYWATTAWTEVRHALMLAGLGWYVTPRCYMRDSAPSRPGTGRRRQSCNVGGTPQTGVTCHCVAAFDVLLYSIICVYGTRTREV